MRICSECGRRNTPGTDFCACGAFLAWEGGPPTNGAPVAAPPGPPPQPAVRAQAPTADVVTTKVLCAVCGTPNPPNRRFCRSCGELLARPPAPAPEPGPVVAPRAPAEPVRGPGDVVPVQPATPKQKPPPEPVPVAAYAPPRPGERACPQCGTTNGPGLRFCQHCGQWIAGLAPTSMHAPVQRATERRRWWHRFVPSRRDGIGASQLARQQYRNTLSLRWRIGRVLAIIAGLGLVAGTFGLIGADPRRLLAGARDRITGGRYEEVVVEAASTAPVPAEINDFPADAAVDGSQVSAWAVKWRPERPPVTGCSAVPGAPGAAGAEGELALRLPPTQLSRIVIEPGTDPANPIQQWRPLEVQVRQDDGSCQTFTLPNAPDAQTFDLQSETETSRVTVTVLQAGPAKAAEAVPLVAIREIRLYRKL